jgi:phospholipase C
MEKINKKYISNLFIVFFLCLLVSLETKVAPSNKIKKIILLCMENHSYDNLVK